MARGKVVVLAVVTALIVSGLLGVEAWRKHQRKQTLIDAIEFRSCDICSTVKRDLAEKVKQREQRSQQTNE